jgi:hypothetical protein
VYRYFGLATSIILPIISRVRKGKVPKLRILSVEVEAITISQARDRKVSEEWINRVEVANPSCHQPFEVKKHTIQCDDNSRAVLEGDIILTLNGSIITRLFELDITDDAEVLDTRVVRCGGEVNLELQTVLADDFKTKRAVLFCGATLQPPHHAARLRVGKPPSEVFVSSVMGGSPASHYGLSPATFITHINDTVGCDLDSFLEVAMTIPGNASKSNLMSDCYWITAKATQSSL